MFYGVVANYHVLEQVQDINNRYKNFTAYLSKKKNGMGKSQFEFLLLERSCALGVPSAYKCHQSPITFPNEGKISCPLICMLTFHASHIAMTT